jgi:glyoxylase-like metal-dependent hydrolase (beta-lactamase superfamily II)
MPILTTIPPGATPIADFDAAWAVTGAGPRLRAVRVAAERLRDRFAAGPRVVAVRTLPLTTLLYPTKYAFNSAARSPAPFVVMTHRAVVVQFLQAGALKTLLFNPTDVEAARATPFLARLVDQFGERAAKLLVETYEPLEAQLARLGIAFADVDYVAFDHFHTQDLRPILGTEDGARPARFPNATLLAPAREWADWDDLHPYQRAWFVRDGKRGVRTEKLVLTSGDLALGDGVVLVRTPGHTSGNQTLFLATEQGVWGVSENGTSADNWSPLDSKIAGLAAMCRRSEIDVVVNANTPEGGADQYTSMILERTLVDRVRRAPAFVQMFPSSEVTPSKLAPGLAPTLLHRAITSGDVAKPARRDAA